MSDAAGGLGGSAADAIGRDEPDLDQLTAEGRRIAEETRDLALGLAEEQKAEGATYLQDLASAVSAMSERLQASGRTGSASYANVAADRLEQIGHNVGSKALDTLARDLRDLVHQRPALVIGGALIAGFSLGLLLKSSARDDSSETPPLDANRT